MFVLGRISIRVLVSFCGKYSPSSEEYSLPRPSVGEESFQTYQERIVEVAVNHGETEFPCHTLGTFAEKE